MASEPEMVVKRVSVPLGLEELMETLTKEVLRKKPDDIYTFASEYFSRLLSMRKETNYKIPLSKVGKSVSQSSNNGNIRKEYTKNDVLKIKTATIGTTIKLKNEQQPPLPIRRINRRNVKAKVDTNLSPRTPQNNNVKKFLEKRRQSLESKKGEQPKSSGTIKNKLKRTSSKSSSSSIISNGEIKPITKNVKEISKEGLKESNNNIENIQEITVSKILPPTKIDQDDKPSSMSIEKAVIVIQSMIRSFITRRRLKANQKLSDVKEPIKNEESSNEVDSVFGGDVQPHVNNEIISEVDNYKNKAATKIQSVWRGHKIRSDTSLTLEQRRKAATVIQALFRGYLTRKAHRYIPMVIDDKERLSTLVEEESVENKVEKVLEDDISLIQRNVQEIKEATKEIEEGTKKTEEEIKDGSKEAVEEIKGINDQTNQSVEEVTKFLEDKVDKISKENIYQNQEELVNEDILNQKDLMKEFVNEDEKDILKVIIESGKDLVEVSSESQPSLIEINDSPNILEKNQSIQEIVNQETDLKSEIKNKDLILGEDETLKVTIENGKDFVEISSEPPEKIMEKLDVETIKRPISKDSTTSADSVDTVIFSNNQIANQIAEPEEELILKQEQIIEDKKIENRDSKSNKPSKQIKEEQVHKEITRYLTTITEPLRRAFSAEIPSTPQKEDKMLKERSLSAQESESPKYIYIPLRQYTEDGDLDDNLLKTKIDTKAEFQIEPKIEKEVVVYSPNIEPTVEPNEAITEYINSIIEPVKQKFSPNGEVKSNVDKKPIEVEPEYQYIPLRTYSEDKEHLLEAGNGKRYQQKIEEHLKIHEEPEVDENHKEGILTRTVSEQIDDIIQNANQVVGHDKDSDIDSTKSVMELNVEGDHLRNKREVSFNQDDCLPELIHDDIKTVENKSKEKNQQNEDKKGSVIDEKVSTDQTSNKNIIDENEQARNTDILSDKKETNVEDEENKQQHGADEENSDGNKINEINQESVQINSLNLTEASITRHDEKMKDAQKENIQEEHSGTHSEAKLKKEPAHVNLSTQDHVNHQLDVSNEENEFPHQPKNENSLNSIEADITHHDEQVKDEQNGDIQEVIQGIPSESRLKKEPIQEDPVTESVVEHQLDESNERDKFPHQIENEDSLNSVKVDITNHNEKIKDVPKGDIQEEVLGTPSETSLKKEPIQADVSTEDHVKHEVDASNEGDKFFHQPKDVDSLNLVKADITNHDEKIKDVPKGDIQEEVLGTPSETSLKKESIQEDQCTENHVKHDVDASNEGDKFSHQPKDEDFLNSVKADITNHDEKIKDVPKGDIQEEVLGTPSETSLKKESIQDDLCTENHVKHYVDASNEGDTFSHQPKDKDFFNSVKADIPNHDEKIKDVPKGDIQEEALGTPSDTRLKTEPSQDDLSTEDHVKQESDAKTQHDKSPPQTKKGDSSEQLEKNQNKCDHLEEDVDDRENSKATVEVQEKVTRNEADIQLGNKPQELEAAKESVRSMEPSTQEKISSEQQDSKNFVEPKSEIQEKLSTSVDEHPQGDLNDNNTKFLNIIDAKESQGIEESKTSVKGRQSNVSSDSQTLVGHIQESIDKMSSSKDFQVHAAQDGANNAENCLDGVLQARTTENSSESKEEQKIESNQKLESTISDGNNISNASLIEDSVLKECNDEKKDSVGEKENVQEDTIEEVKSNITNNEIIDRHNIEPERTSTEKTEKVEENQQICINGHNIMKNNPKLNHQTQQLMEDADVKTSETYKSVSNLEDVEPFTDDTLDNLALDSLESESFPIKTSHEDQVITNNATLNHERDNENSDELTMMDKNSTQTQKENVGFKMEKLELTPLRNSKDSNESLRSEELTQDIVASEQNLKDDVKLSKSEKASEVNIVTQKQNEELTLEQTKINPLHQRSENGKELLKSGESIHDVVSSKENFKKDEDKLSNAEKLLEVNNETQKGNEKMKLEKTSLQNSKDDHEISKSDESTHDVVSSSNAEKGSEVNAETQKENNEFDERKTQSKDSNESSKSGESTHDVAIPSENVEKDDIQFCNAKQVSKVNTETQKGNEDLKLENTAVTPLQDSNNGNETSKNDESTHNVVSSEETRNNDDIKLETASEAEDGELKENEELEKTEKIPVQDSKKSNELSKRDELSNEVASKSITREDHIVKEKQQKVETRSSTDTEEHPGSKVVLDNNDAMIKESHEKTLEDHNKEAEMADKSEELKNKVESKSEDSVLKSDQDDGIDDNTEKGNTSKVEIVEKMEELTKESKTDINEMLNVKHDGKLQNDNTKKIEVAQESEKLKKEIKGDDEPSKNNVTISAQNMEQILTLPEKINNTNELDKKDLTKLNEENQSANSTSKHINAGTLENQTATIQDKDKTESTEDLSSQKSKSHEPVTLKENHDIKENPSSVEVSNNDEAHTITSTLNKDTKTSSSSSSMHNRKEMITKQPAILEAVSEDDSIKENKKFKSNSNSPESSMDHGTTNLYMSTFKTPNFPISNGEDVEGRKSISPIEINCSTSRSLPSLPEEDTQPDEVIKENETSSVSVSKSEPFYLHRQGDSSKAIASSDQEKAFSKAFQKVNGVRYDSVPIRGNLGSSGSSTEELNCESSFGSNLGPASEPTIHPTFNPSFESTRKEPAATQPSIQCNISVIDGSPTSALPLALEMSQSAAGAAFVTETTLSGAQAQNCASGRDQADIDQNEHQRRAESVVAMDTVKRNNSSIVKKTQEQQAATKIQASFRGYQVRKKLKNKTISPKSNGVKRICRRKSSGRTTMDPNKNSNKKPTDLEEQSATKIQAGVRGFLVRRRQKKTKSVPESP